jgi:ABC-type branched-subunit amino acid transport system substrate-binding protein
LKKYFKCTQAEACGHRHKGRPLTAGPPSSFLLCVTVLVLTLFAPGLSASYAFPLTLQEERGKHIYFRGTSPAGNTIIAYFGKDVIEMPGERATCASCHGYDGLGRPESGVLPTNITWPYLMKSYGHLHPNGLEHPAFTEESLKSYMKDGIYPGGKKGDPAMPLYSMAGEDLEALIAYLKRLGTVPDPGLADGSIRIGTLLPREGIPAEMGDVMEKTIRAYFDDINEKGGIYGRKLELTVQRPAGQGPLTGERLGSMLRQLEVFALVSTFVPGLHREMASAAEAEATPLIGPFTLFPLESSALNRYTFYILSGLREQMKALVDYSASVIKVENPAVAILVPSGRETAEVAAAVEEQCRRRGWQRVARIEFPSNQFDAGSIVRRLKSDHFDLLFFLGLDTEVRVFLERIQGVDRIPYILLPAVLAGESIYDIPRNLRDRVFLAMPSLPWDRKEWGMSEFLSLSKKHNLPAAHLAAQISAYSSTKILLEGLRRAGRELNRERLLSSLEGLFEFSTGLTPPITYNRNRRIGALGAYVVAVEPDDKEKDSFISLKGWVTPD